MQIPLATTTLPFGHFAFVFAFFLDTCEFVSPFRSISFVLSYSVFLTPISLAVIRICFVFQFLSLSFPFVLFFSWGVRYLLAGDTWQQEEDKASREKNIRKNQLTLSQNEMLAAQILTTIRHDNRGAISSVHVGVTRVGLFWHPLSRTWTDTEHSYRRWNQWGRQVTHGSWSSWWNTSKPAPHLEPAGMRCFRVREDKHSQIRRRAPSVCVRRK